MAKEIAWRVPMLAQRDEDMWEEAERTRRKFISDYPLKRLSALKLDDFVIGKGADNRSFCYRLEREMDVLGKIVGATAFKFGVYFGRTNKDAKDRYRFAKHWGSNHQEAFAAVKQAIVDLLQAAAKNDYASITENPLSPMFKGKILFVYNPDKFAPIYAWKHLEHFIIALDLDGSFESEADMQRALMDYRARWPKLRAQPPALYMHLLYDLFDYPEYDTATRSPVARIPILKSAVEGAQFIAKMPALPTVTTAKSAGRWKVNHEERQKNSKRIGDRGELVVLALEQQRLIEAGKKKLAQKVDHVAQRYDGLGYDILSFDEDGKERQVEVKATRSANLLNGFYISANELEKSKRLPNYHLYLVFSAMSKSPRVFRMKKPTLEGLGFKLEPLNYHVTLSGICAGINS